MITIFDILNDIICHKKQDVISNTEEWKMYQGFLVNRWLSFYSHDYLYRINQTINKHSACMDQSMQYKYLVKTLPKSSVKRIDYIKKVKEDKEKKNDKRQVVVEFLSKRLELSQREINYLLENLNTKDLEKTLCQKLI